ncbi:dihydroxyacetone kinase [Verruconis gallopava]|uniref:Dihydroxyacetone kinase n=1 Tax=Verruconis gallopava TaxID=253628 RepID=A0A0D2ADZ5_9PEZI|nr:dihydroxyacetone kinase [Verruconis gallopava]KIW04690.1 dihydroxyacetone kinase [Verruconis gallopava]
MRSKHFLDETQTIVNGSLRSLAITNPALQLDEQNKIIYSRSFKISNAVKIISGGGSGHEPSFGGFVGEGGLTAAVAGNVFASPSSQQILHAIERFGPDSGVLVTVMNYTGDVLNFGVAVEKARARNPELSIRMLVVADDCSIPDSQVGKVGKRGIAGTVLVHKITGAAAAAGWSLDEIFQLGQVAKSNLASIGTSLDRVHVPGQPTKGDESLEDNQVELGMGIHNERGISRLQGTDAKLAAVVGTMLDHLFKSLANGLGGAGSLEMADLVLMVNNLGGLSVLEFGSIVAEVTDQLKRRTKKSPKRVYAGTFMTSLDGPGFSISILNLSATGKQDTILQFLDAPSDALGWVAPKKWASSDFEEGELPKQNTNSPNGAESAHSVVEPHMQMVAQHIMNAMNAVIAAEPEVTRYDQIVGDGDCGTTLKRGAEAVLRSLSNTPSSLAMLVESITQAVESTMDGTSGAIYAIFFNSLMQYVKTHAQDPDSAIDPAFWSQALDSAISTLRQYTAASVGDRTLMDTLLPFSETLRMSHDISAAAAAATKGAESTKSMKASLGRSVYVGGENEWLGTIPDPGAWGLMRLFDGLARSIKGSSSAK